MKRPPTFAEISRRTFLQASAGLGVGLAPGLFATEAHAQLTPGTLPAEPLAIGHEPQFLFDLHVIDCTWNLREKHEPVRRVFHSAEKHPGNPLLTGDQPSHLWVTRDDPSGPFRMWYQINRRLEFPDGKPANTAAYESFVGYAESSDGVSWERPALNLFKSASGVPSNCVLHRIDSPHAKMDAAQMVHVPEKDRRGYLYTMLYKGGGPDRNHRGIRLVGSHDGVHWDLERDQLIAPIASDHPNTIVYDRMADQYVLYLRAKHIYLAPGQGRDRLDSGQSRRGVARMTSPQLWTEWTTTPQTILVPDEVDAEAGYNYFYGMPTREHAGIFWGFLQSFRMNDYMHAELAWSRDGVNFQRLPERPKIIEYGTDGAWDDTMILACPHWIEVGDEWWVYYNGWDGPHETPERTGGIGLAKLRKEGLVSMRGPRDGGVVCTRALTWPGGELMLNADARDGELTVRVSDELRKPIEGFDHDDGSKFAGNDVGHVVKWGDRSLDELRGRTIRLEFLLRDADLYTFRAG